MKSIVCIAVSALLSGCTPGSSSSDSAGNGDSGSKDGAASNPDASMASTDGPRSDSLDLSPSDAPGAAVAFTTIEAEAPGNVVKGSTVRLSGLPTDVSSPEMEASGRAYVQLTAQGDSLTFLNVPETNTLVIRNSIPDAPSGGGTTATLSLYVNGAKKQTLLLSSHHNWLYGKLDDGGGDSATSNDPDAGPPHAFWDEARFIVDDVPAGSTITLLKDAGDTASFYRIDLVDLEVAPPPLSPPPAGTYLDLVKDYGADPSGTQDCSAALKKALGDAKAQNKSVWLPAGTFTVSTALSIDSVVVHGAGMWRTTVFRNVPIPHDPGTRYFMNLSGAAPGITDLFVDSTGVGRFKTEQSDTGISGGGTNWLVENVWLTHTATGLWIGGTNGVVRGSRVRFTYADGININSGAMSILAEQNHVRGTGDDGMAILSQVSAPPASENVTLRHNTVEAVWWGGNIDLAGGGGIVIEDNLVADNALDGCLIVNMPTGGYAMSPLTSGTISNNVLARCGGNSYGQERGAMWIFTESGAVQSLVVQNNTIQSPIFRGIQLAGSSTQSVTFDSNHVDMNEGGLDAVVVDSEVVGSGVFTDNVVEHVAATFSQFKNTAPVDKYKVTSTNNTW